jgi:hypothetical protein
MKKFLIIGFAGLLLLLSVLVYGLTDTGAWFSDTVSSTGNQLTAAALKLNVNDSSGTSQTFVLDKIKPGDLAPGGQVILKNDGTIPGHLWFEIVNVTPANGLLGDLIHPKFRADVEPWTSFGGDLAINQSIGIRVDVVDLAPGDSISLVVFFNWPLSEHDNDAQGATLSFDVTWHLDQLPTVP